MKYTIYTRGHDVRKYIYDDRGHIEFDRTACFTRQPKIKTTRACHSYVMFQISSTCSFESVKSKSINFQASAGVVSRYVFHGS